MRKAHIEAMHRIRVTIHLKKVHRVVGIDVSTPTGLLPHSPLDTSRPTKEELQELDRDVE
jgi:hypothetical protein